MKRLRPKFLRLNRPTWVAAYFCCVWPSLLLAPPARSGTGPVDLAKVTISDALVEDARLVPLNQPQAAAFNAEAHRLMTRVFPHYNWIRNPVAFVLSAELEPRNFEYRAGRIKLLGVAIRDLKLAKSLDEMAAIIGQIFSRHVLKVQKGDQVRESNFEAALEKSLMEKLAASGFNPEVVLHLERRQSFLRRSRDPQSKRTESETVLKTLRHKYGGGFAPEKPLAENLKTCWNTAQANSYVEKMKQEANWDLMTPGARLAFLQVIISSMPAWNRARTADVLSTVREIPFDFTDPSQKTAHDSLVEKISQIPPEIPSSIAEEVRMIPLNSKEGQSFNELAHDLMTKLSPDYDWARNPVAFVMFSDDSIQDFQYRKGGIKVIGISLNQLKESQSLDEVTALIGKEWQRHLSRLKAGELIEDLKGGAGSEDLFPIAGMVSAKMNPEAALRIIKRPSPSAYSDYEDLIVSPPLGRERVRTIERRIAGLKSYYGSFSAETALPAEVKAIFRDARR